MYVYTRAAYVEEVEWFDFLARLLLASRDAAALPRLPPGRCTLPSQTTAPYRCNSIDTTVDWVAYRCAWVRGGCAGPLSSPSSSPGPGGAIGNPIDCRVNAVTPGTTNVAVMDAHTSCVDRLG